MTAKCKVAKEKNDCWPGLLEEAKKKKKKKKLEYVCDLKKNLQRFYQHRNAAELHIVVCVTWIGAFKRSTDGDPFRERLTENKWFTFKSTTNNTHTHTYTNICSCSQAVASLSRLEPCTHTRRAPVTVSTDEAPVDSKRLTSYLQSLRRGLPHISRRERCSVFTTAAALLVVRLTSVRFHGSPLCPPSLRTAR